MHDGNGSITGRELGVGVEGDDLAHGRRGICHPGGSTNRCNRLGVGPGNRIARDVEQHERRVGERSGAVEADDQDGLVAGIVEVPVPHRAVGANRVLAIDVDGGDLDITLFEPKAGHGHDVDASFGAGDGVWLTRDVEVGFAFRSVFIGTHVVAEDVGGIPTEENIPSGIEQQESGIGRVAFGIHAGHGGLHGGRFGHDAADLARGDAGVAGTGGRHLHISVG